MQYKNIPRTDMRVSVICLGTMNWGQQNTETDAHAQLDHATSHGINFIDTAEMYPVPPDPKLQGRSEEFLGSWLKKSGKRSELIIASKVSPSPIVTTRKHRRGKPRLDEASIREAIEGTLRRLQTDYLDLYQIHWPERTTNYFGVRAYQGGHEDEEATPIEETLGTLNDLVKEGLVRKVGVSNETPWGLMEYVRLSREKGFPHIVTVQNQYSLTNRTFEIGNAEVALREDIGLLAYSPLSMGVLSGKYLGGAKPEGARFTLFERNRGRYNPERAQEAIGRYVEVAKKHGLSPAQMALAFVHSRPFTTSAIIGVTTIPQLEENIAAGDLILAPEVLADIEAVYTDLPDPTV